MLWNERVGFCLAVIIGIIIGSSPVIVKPILENMLPGLVLWPVFLACICVALIVWWFTRSSVKFQSLPFQSLRTE